MHGHSTFNVPLGPFPGKRCVVQALWMEKQKKGNSSTRAELFAIVSSMSFFAEFIKFHQTSCNHNRKPAMHLERQWSFSPQSQVPQHYKVSGKTTPKCRYCLFHLSFDSDAPSASQARLGSLPSRRNIEAENTTLFKCLIECQSRFDSGYFSGGASNPKFGALSSHEC